MEKHIIDGKEVIYYPAKPCRVLSEAIKYYMCALVPKGRLITREALEEFLAKKLNIERIEFDPKFFDKMRYIEEVKKWDRTYRIVSIYGRIDKVDMKKLREEGFTFEPATKYMVKVKDFKNYLFDFETETDIDAEWIERIDKTGYASLKELDGM